MFNFGCENPSKNAWEQSHPQWCTKSFKSSWKDHSLSPQPADCISLHHPFDSVPVATNSRCCWPRLRILTFLSASILKPEILNFRISYLDLSCSASTVTWKLYDMFEDLMVCTQNHHFFLGKLETYMISWYLHVLDNKSVILDVAFPMTSFRCFASKVTAKLVTVTGLWVGEVPATSRSSEENLNLGIFQRIGQQGVCV